MNVQYILYSKNCIDCFIFYVKKKNFKNEKRYLQYLINENIF